MQRSVTGWLGVLAVTGLLVLTAYVVVLPRLLYPPLSHSELRNVPTPKERIELQQAQGALQNNARTPLLQGLGSVLLAVGAIATWQQIKISREGQITDRFTHAIDQLGSDNPVVRVGGIRALERIAKNSPADRATIAYVLGAFVRTKAPWPVGAPMGPQHPTPTVDEQLPWLQHRAADVQTAMWVLGSRPTAPEPVWLYLSRVDLRLAQLVDGHLTDTELQYVNLACARDAGSAHGPQRSEARRSAPSGSAGRPTAWGRPARDLPAGREPAGRQPAGRSARASRSQQRHRGCIHDLAGWVRCRSPSCRRSAHQTPQATRGGAGGRRRLSLQLSSRCWSGGGS